MSLVGTMPLAQAQWLAIELDGFELGAIERWSRGGNAKEWRVKGVVREVREGRGALSVEYHLQGNHLALWRTFDPPLQFGADDALQLWVWNGRPKAKLQLVVDMGATQAQLMGRTYLRHRRRLDWQGWRTITLTRRSFWLTNRGTDWPERLGCLRLIVEASGNEPQNGTVRFDGLRILPRILAEPKIDEQKLQNWRPMPKRRMFGVTLNPKGFSYVHMPDTDKLARQCRALKSIGVDTLRMDIAWAAVQPREGQWRFAPWRERLRAIVSAGLKLKPILSFHVVPGWFWQKYPDAQMRDSRGRTSRQWISYWHPELRPRQQRFTERCMRDLLREFDASIVAVHVAVGMYGEPHYPSLPHPPAFWCYGDRPQADFRTRMRERYRSIEPANAAWGTDFPNWDSVRVPAPNTRPGPFRQDVLWWYRQVRDEHVIWALDMTSRYTSRPLVIYGGAGHVGPGHWRLAVASGGADWPGGWRIKGMGDFTHFFPFIVKRGWWTEPAGLPRLHGVTRTIALCIANGWNVTIWGENVGGAEGHDPLATADIVRRYRFDGMEFLPLDPLFDKNGNPTPLFERLREAVRRVKSK